jgi:uncharacterized protein (TIGR03435 family)
MHAIRIGLILGAAAVAFGQTAPAPEFDVASIKLSTDAPGASSGIDTDTGKIHAHNVTLKRCIRGAYDIPEARIVGGPKWVDEERYVIDAKAPGPAGTHDLMAMLQQLLAERFQLTFHRETRPLPGYAIVVSKKGMLAKPSQANGGTNASSSRHNIDATGCDMACLAMKVSEVLHMPVTDATGVDGRFDFKLEWVPDDLQTAVGPALEEQLGLKLEGRKVPTEVIVIDRAEKATIN